MFVSLIILLTLVLVYPKCHSESKLDLGVCSTQFLPSWPAGRSCFDMAMPALFIRNMPVLAWSKSNLFMETLVRWKSRDVHDQTKRWPLSSIIYFIDVIAHLPRPAWSKSNLFKETGGQWFSRDVPHQRKRWPQPFIIHVMTHTPDPAWPKSNLFMVTGGRWKTCDVLWCCASKVARRHARACRTYF